MSAFDKNGHPPSRENDKGPRAALHETPDFKFGRVGLCDITVAEAQFSTRLCRKMQPGLEPVALTRGASVNITSQRFSTALAKFGVHW